MVSASQASSWLSFRVPPAAGWGSCFTIATHPTSASVGQSIRFNVRVCGTFTPHNGAAANVRNWAEADGRFASYAVAFSKHRPSSPGEGGQSFDRLSLDGEGKSDRRRRSRHRTGRLGPPPAGGGDQARPNGKRPDRCRSGRLRDDRSSAPWSFGRALIAAYRKLPRTHGPCLCLDGQWLRSDGALVTGGVVVALPIAATLCRKRNRRRHVATPRPAP